MSNAIGPTAEDLEEGQRDAIEAERSGALYEGPNDQESALEMAGYRDWLREQEIKRASHEAAHHLGLCRCGKTVLTDVAH